METETRPSFIRDLKRVRSASIRRRVERTIESIETATNVAAIPGIARITATGDPHYRIRIGDYRLGLAVQGSVVVLVRFLHRSDIYRFFP